MQKPAPGWQISASSGRGIRIKIAENATPQAPAVRHRFRFEGPGGEYFKIWTVNLALDILAGVKRTA
jgi:hypothetical protein